MKQRTVFILLFIIVAALIATFFIGKNKLADHFRQKGLVLYDSLQFEDAATMFSKSLKWSSSAVTEIDLAKSFYNLKKYNAVDSLCRIVIQTDSTMAEAYATHGQVLVKLNQGELAVKQLNKALELDSTLYYALYYRGIAYASVGKYELALSDYEKAKDRMENTSDVYLSSVAAKTFLEDYSGAIEDYTHLIELNNNNTEAIYMRGYLRYKTNDLKGAIKDFSTVISLSDTIGKAYYYKGLSEVMSGNLHTAINDFYLSEENSYKRDASLYNAGKAQYELGQFPDASISLTKLTDTYKQSEYKLQAFQILGAMSLSKSDFKQAQSYFSQAVKTDSASASAYYYRAIANENLKNFSMAVEDLNRCLKLGMTTSDVYFARGVQYINLSQFDNGCKDFSTAAIMGHSQAEKFTNMYCKNR